MWQVIYVANNIEEAEEIKELVSARGFLVEINVKGSNYQIKAPELEAESVYRVIINNLR